MFIPFFGTKITNGIHFILLKRRWAHWTNLEGIKGMKITFLKRLLHEGETKEYKHFVPFFEVIKTRQKQAKQSILVQVQSKKSYKELETYCSQYGAIKEMFHYKAGKEPLHFILVEFQKEASVMKVLRDCEHIQDSQIVPVESTFLWFRASKNNSVKKQTSQLVLTIENGNCPLSEENLRSKLQACDSISEQIEILYESTKLNDLGVRLRFLSARQIEVALSGIFPSAVAFPFGSCVNGFGKMNCDLDVVLRLTKDKISDGNRLIYHCKASGTSERLTSQRHMETIGDFIHLFLPGCSQVRKILQARVPIIKYYQQLTDVECDLSMGNMSGVYMSDLLHIWGSTDARVRPLVFVVRKWAEEVGLTNNFPGRWITNFSLTLMDQTTNILQKMVPTVLFYVISENLNSKQKIMRIWSHC
ncbi:poly(A) RNA polymerase, mitochondrial isoform X2 [Agrilus planipennis]|uniref:Poly(A) RNA polymerase, mitochondrial isoform X2 n=1 Tax=Agrilus planipennis TaxID=224129 RepID=A0A7F5RGW8_AGRPL|nr:poly(A) RNA polymerase, mitochondrial isoform X2 [Agrilus planipennis]